jgi:hypothetical protein
VNTFRVTVQAQVGNKIHVSVKASTDGDARDKAVLIARGRWASHDIVPGWVKVTDVRPG